MENKITPENRGYRRGMIFGYTMAEVVLLLVFILLLLMGYNIAKQNEKIALEGKRVLALAYKDLGTHVADADELESLMQPAAYSDYCDERG